MADNYEDLLKKIGESAKLEKWLEGERGGRRSSVKEGNLWSLAFLAAGALHYLLRHIFMLRSAAMDAQEGGQEAAQIAFEMVPEQPASARDLKNIIHAFFGTQGMEDDDTGRPPRPSEPAVPTAPVGADAHVDDIPPGTVLAALGGHLGNRSLTEELVGLWSPEDRRAAFAWGKNRSENGDAPPPEVLTRRYLEDLNLAMSADDRAELLNWVGVPVTGLVELWSPEVWGGVLAWAVAAHRKDRGEAVSVPSCPDVLIPDDSLYVDLTEFAYHSDAVTREELIERFRAEDYGVTFAIDALLQFRDLAPDDEGAYRAEAPTPRTPVEFLAEVARAGAERREPNDLARVKRDEAAPPAPAVVLEEVSEAEHEEVGEEEEEPEESEEPEAEEEF